MRIINTINDLAGYIEELSGPDCTHEIAMNAAIRMRATRGSPDYGTDWEPYIREITDDGFFDFVFNSIE